jgi:hypothetical protein
MTSSKEIHDLISVYLKTKGLDTFAAAFAELFYDIENTGDQDTIQLAYSVESLLAAASAGVCSEASLYESLKALSPSLSVVFYSADVESKQQVAPYEFFMKWAASGAAGTGKPVSVDISPSVGFGSKAVLLDIHQTSTDLPPWQQVIPAV